MRRLTGLIAVAVLAGCQGQGQAPPRPSPTPTPAPAVALAAPAQAILGDADAGLPRTGGTDSLTAAELAAAAPDEVVALAELNGWGWVAGARRSWADGGRRLDVLVVLTDRPEGARRAFAHLGAEAAAAPLAAGPCPAPLSGLDDCVAGGGGGRQIFAGRLDAEVFQLTASGFDATPLAARQAARLRAT